MITDAELNKVLVDAPENEALTAYQRVVRRAAIRFANENDYCVQTLNEFLERVGLKPFPGDDKSEFRGTATVTGYYRQEVPVLTADEARTLVQVTSNDQDVRIDRSFDPAVVSVHDDRVVMLVHIIVVDTSNGATATSWAISALELASTAARKRTVLGFRDPMFDHSNVTEVVYTGQPEADPDADCWEED